MTALTDLTPEESAIVQRTPTAVALGAAYSQQDGAVSLMREMKAGLAAAAQAAIAFPDNAIVRELAAEMQEMEDDDLDPHQAGDAATDIDDEIVEERSPGRAPEASIDLARQSMAIMEEKATLEESVEFKHWLYEIAKQVTLAAKSGGFLGFGGEQVAAGELAYLTELQEALQIEL